MKTKKCYICEKRYKIGGFSKWDCCFTCEINITFVHMIINVIKTRNPNTKMGNLLELVDTYYPGNSEEKK